MREKLVKRLPVALSATALVLVIFGPAPWAGAHGVAHALFAHKAGSAQTAAKLTSLTGLNNSACTRDGKRGVVAVGHFRSSDTRASDTSTGVTVDCVVRDKFETAGNDTGANAAVLDPAANPTLSGATIYPAGNDDWYQVTGSLSGFRTNGMLSVPKMDIYRDGTPVATGVTCWSNPNTAPSHTWKVRVDSTVPRAYSFSFPRTFDFGVNCS